MSLYDALRKNGNPVMGLPKHSQHKPTAVCSWCDYYDAKSRWCSVKSQPIPEPLTLSRCRRYLGEPVTDNNLKSVYEVLDAGSRVS